MGYYQFHVYQNMKEAETYFKKSVQFSEKIKAFDSNYYYASLLYLAKISVKLKDYNAAENYINSIIKKADRKNSQRKEASKLYQEIKKLKKDSKRGKR